jgi:hypothetical protein
MKSKALLHLMRRSRASYFAAEPHNATFGEAEKHIMRRSRASYFAAEPHNATFGEAEKHIMRRSRASYFAAQPQNASCGAAALHILRRSRASYFAAQPQNASCGEAALHTAKPCFIFLAICLCFLACPAVLASGATVPVGEYLYADVAKLPNEGSTLTVTFAAPDSSRLVIAFGRQNRKDRTSRDGTSEAEREMLKPRLAKMSADGIQAVFVKLPPDYYDLLVVSTSTMTVHEGISICQDDDDEGAKAVQPPDEQLLSGLRQTLAPQPGKIGSGWDGFFDHKQFDRVESSGDMAGLVLQQLRRGESYQESGDKVAGCIHSLDVLWLDRTADATAWRLIQRQQLYRAELPSTDFFRHQFLPALQGIRCGRRDRTVGPLAMP